MLYEVLFTWDSEAEVWTATSEDVPGLVLESGSVDALMERVKYAIPELLELNQVERKDSIHFLIEKKERLYAYG